MFYSHEVLTNRKHGVATIWLVATLGSKSRTKKVTRKAILGVNLKKACETIIEPEAPMALRLQSNLLYGVTRVYTQKWDYLLTDAQAVHYNIRSFFKTSQGHQIDKNAGKARPEQLVLADDPAFVVDSLLVPPPLDLEGMGLRNSHGSSQSIFSISQRRDSAISDDNSSVIGLNIPTSSHDGMSPYHAPSHKSIGDSVIAEEGVSHKAVTEDEENLLLQNDDLFEIDEDGIIRELTGHEERRHSFDSMSPGGGGHIRKMHLDGTVGHRFPDPSLTSKNVIHDNVTNEYMSGNGNPTSHNTTADIELENQISDPENISHLSVKALQRPRKSRTRKNFATADIITELGNTEISRMMSDYPENMLNQSLLKTRAKVQAESKRVAYYYVFGYGINSIGEARNSYSQKNPLDQFHGDDLSRVIRGQQAMTPAISKKRGRLGSDNIASAPAKRARNFDSEQGRTAFPADMAQNIPDESFQSHMDDGSLEFGRDAASALKDPPSSSVMPWNISASALSYQRSGNQRHASHLLAASPLIGRGSTFANDLNRLLPGQDELIGLPEYDTGSFLLPVKPLEYNHQVSDPRPREGVGLAKSGTTMEPGAHQREWLPDTLDEESSKFLAFVQSQFHFKQRVEFAALVSPTTSSAVVAAHAFYHVLNLANQQLVRVTQRDSAVGNINGAILITPCR